MRKDCFRIAAVTLLTLLCSIVPPSVMGQTLSDKLEQQTGFQPLHGSAAEQLVQVAQEFKIPMAIEWLEEVDQPIAPLDFHKGRVLDLLAAIVRRSPEHQLAIRQKMVYVYPPQVANHPFNFLNLRIPNYRVTKQSLFGAEDMLKHSINALLYPDLYRGGFGGGYGGSQDNSFREANVTVSGVNLTIRDLLTRIARANSHALWIVRLRPSEFKENRPLWEGVPIDRYGHSPLNTRWKFLPLEEKRRSL